MLSAPQYQYIGAGKEGGNPHYKHPEILGWMRVI